VGTFHLRQFDTEQVLVYLDGPRGDCIENYRRTDAGRASEDGLAGHEGILRGTCRRSDCIQTSRATNAICQCRMHVGASVTPECNERANLLQRHIPLPRRYSQPHACDADLVKKCRRHDSSMPRNTSRTRAHPRVAHALMLACLCYPELTMMCPVMLRHSSMPRKSKALVHILKLHWHGHSISTDSPHPLKDMNGKQGLCFQ
jgi:hypothetical protein